MFAALFAGLVGCALPAVAHAGEGETATRTLLSAAYEDIASVYIRNVPLRKPALHGVRSALEPADHLRVERDGAKLRLYAGTRRAATFRMPDARDPGKWAGLTQRVLRAAAEQAEAVGDGSTKATRKRLLQGMAGVLDRYSRYAGAAAARANRARRDGYGGIGVRVRPSGEALKILSVLADSPASDAGLEAGDRIRAIDGHPVAGMALETALNRLRGRIDSDVRLRIADAPNSPASPTTLTRAYVVPRTVTATRRDGIAHLRVSGFNRETAETLRAEIRAAAADLGPRLNGYVLDLRDNPGGLLDEAVEVADLFLRTGRIVSTRGRHPDSHQTFDAGPRDVTDGAPLVVLINGASASASEIVAAALQDADRALVVGTASYGKGTIQTVLRLPNDGELTLTWARFHAPSGYALAARGVLPDVCTSRAGGDGSGVLRALRRGTQPLARHVVQRDVPRDARDRIKALRAHCPAKRTERPVDMRVARSLLRQRTLYRRAAGDRRALLARKIP